MVPTCEKCRWQGWLWTVSDGHAATSAATVARRDSGQGFVLDLELMFVERICGLMETEGSFAIPGPGLLFNRWARTGVMC